MSRGLRFAVAALMALCVLLPGGARGAEWPRKDKNVPTEKHPYLFFTADDLPAMQESAKKPPASKFFEMLGKANGLKEQALRGLLTGNKGDIEAAKRALLSTYKNWPPGAPNVHHGTLLREAGIGYDLLYNDLSDQEKKQIEDYLAAGAGFLYREGQTGTNWSGRGNRGGGNWTANMYGGMGVAGLALWNKNPDAKKWVADAAAVAKDVLDYHWDPDGAVGESYDRYGAGTIDHAVFPFLEMLRRVTGEDLFGYNDSILKRAVKFTAYMITPDRQAVLSIGDTDEGLSNAGISLIKAAAEFDEGLAAWYVDALLADGGGAVKGDVFWGTIWAKPVKIEDPDASPRLPLAFAYNNDAAAKKVDKTTDHGWGFFFLRTGFASKDDVYFAGQAGDMAGFHSHSDQGSYVFAAYGIRFLRDFFDSDYSGPQYTYFQGGEAHQILLIDGQGQGAGQIGLRDAEYGTQKAKIEVFESRKGYDYARINTKLAYQVNPANRSMQKAMRHVVFVRLPERQAYVVVVDDVQKDGAAHEYSHTFHYPHRPWTPLDCKLAQDNKIVLGNDDARLYITAVHPQGFKAERLNRYRGDYVKLTCTEKVPRFVMMTVLYPIKGAGEPPAYTAINEGDNVGVEVSGGAKIVFNKATEKADVTGKLSDIIATEKGK